MTVDLSHPGLVRLAATVIAVAMALYHMWAIAFGAPEAILFRGTHLLFALVLIFLLYRWNGETGEAPPTFLDYALLALGAAPIIHLFVNYNYVVTRIYYIDDLTPADMIFAVIIVLVVMEATRRVIGYATHIVASCKLPADTVYGMTKAIATNTATLASIVKDIAALKPNAMAEDIGVPFHAGAAKFYKEAGITVMTR